MEFQEASTSNGGHQQTAHHHQSTPTSMIYAGAASASADSMSSTLNSFSDLGEHHSMHTGGPGLSLKQQVMLNQFMSITGCCIEQSIQFLTSTNWQYQTALSLFFDDFSLLTASNQANNSTSITPNTKQLNFSGSSASIPFTNLSLCNVPLVPCSTPVTPPNLDYLEKAFSKLGGTSSSSSSTTHQSSTGSATVNSNSRHHSNSSSLNAINTNL